MESEKVKEIKENLEEEISFSKEYDLEFRRMSSDTLQDILTLINELESENDTLHTNLCEWRKENQKLKNRIAKLEKELTNDRVFYKEGICYPMNCQGALKQFAERLIEKKIRLGERFNIYDIDETLKEVYKGGL